MMGIAVWSFCRLYYFGFYVIERYIDPSYRFSGFDFGIPLCAADAGQKYSASRLRCNRENP